MLAEGNTIAPEDPEWILNDAQWPVAPTEPYYIMVPVHASFNPTPLANTVVDVDEAAVLPLKDGVGVDWAYLAVLEAGVRALCDVLAGGDEATLRTMLQRPSGTYTRPY